jgi:hypothetical protein
MPRSWPSSTRQAISPGASKVPFPVRLCECSRLTPVDGVRFRPFGRSSGAVAVLRTVQLGQILRGCELRRWGYFSVPATCLINFRHYSLVNDQQCMYALDSMKLFYSPGHTLSRLPLRLFALLDVEKVSADQANKEIQFEAFCRQSAI